MTELAERPKVEQIVEPSGRPWFVSAHEFRAYMTPGRLNRYALVDGIMVSSFISRSANKGRPLQCKAVDGTKMYRLADVWARARADAVRFQPPHEVQIAREIEDLRRERNALWAEVAQFKHEAAVQHVSSRLTGRTLLREHEIAASRLDLPTVSGVYFLLRGERVVYVGQSSRIFGRVLTHMGTKNFDGFAYIPCELNQMDVLESLYIHLLRPELNGAMNGGAIPVAPIAFDRLLSLIGEPAKC